MDQFGKVGLSVSVSIPPVFESLYAGRLRPDELVVDWNVSAVVADGVEKACVGVLVD